jgi:hypothetical protein
MTLSIFSHTAVSQNAHMRHDQFIRRTNKQHRKGGKNAFCVDKFLKFISQFAQDGSVDVIPCRDFSSTGSAALTIFNPVSRATQYSSIVCRTVIQ